MQSPFLTSVSEFMFLKRYAKKTIETYIRHSASLLGINLLVDTPHTINDDLVPILNVED